MLIGLCGMPGAGKSEVRKILVQDHGFYALDTKVILRDMAARLTGLYPSDFVTQEDKATDFKGVRRRKIMGELGNAVEAMFGDSFLLNRSLEEFARISYPDKRIVVDSLRKDQTKDFPGLVCEILSDNAIDTGNDFDKYDKSRINNWIINVGSLDQLRDSVASVFNL